MAPDVHEAIKTPATQLSFQHSPPDCELNNCRYRWQAEPGSKRLLEILVHGSSIRWWFSLTSAGLTRFLTKTEQLVASRIQLLL